MKLKIILLILWGMLLCPLAALRELQYCVDLDGIEDEVQSIALSEEDSSEISIPIDLSPYSYGLHRLSIRVRDDLNQWSQYAHRNVFRIPSDQAVTHIYYCIDDGPQQNISISQIGDDLWMSSDQIVFPPDTAPGLHLLKFHAANSQGHNSHFNCRVVQYIPPQQDNGISYFTWYFSGHEANPTQSYSHSISPAQIDVTAELVLSLPSLTPGQTYTLNIAAIREDGRSSLVATYDFAYQLNIENLSITLDGQQILISWDEIPGALNYLVETKTDPETEGIWQEIPTNSFSKPITSEKEFYRVKVRK
jgi:hypothetical protein